MSPRDEFAVAALTGLVAKGSGDFPPEMRSIEYLVRYSYEIADEMVAQQKPSADNFEIFELACAVADAWAAELVRIKKTLPHGSDAEEVLHDRDPVMFEALKCLEVATRPCQMRKVRP